MKDESDTSLRSSFILDRSSLSAYAQLVRLPNVFTALADITLGALATAALAGSPTFGWYSVLMLMAASACLYSAGMVWNDYFDLEQDRRERPDRPIPSGRVTTAAAARLGLGLLAVGLMNALLSGWHHDGWDGTAGVLAVYLISSILLYDAWLKRTWAGPLGMGACRFLNVLLGLSGGWRMASQGWGIHLAAVVGIYIVGVTWFARTEARISRRSTLLAGGGVILAALLAALPLPLWFPRGTSSPVFLYLLVGLGFFVVMPVANAIARPIPSTVQAAVKRAIFGLVVLDATLATVVAGLVGLVILLWLLPGLYLGRWLYST
jgi:4-hydroxybenzoate polyprenyltransferase